MPEQSDTQPQPKTPQPPRRARRWGLIVTGMVMMLCAAAGYAAVMLLYPAVVEQAEEFAPPAEQTQSTIETQLATEATVEPGGQTPTTEEPVPATAGPTVPPSLPAFAPPQTLPASDGVMRTVDVPILMYHYVSEPPSDADVYRVDLSVTPDEFRNQMAWLKENGYQAVTLYEIAAALNSEEAALPPRPVVITFDDGYEDNYHNAFPILKEMEMPATFFVLTDVTDRSEAGYMTWPMLEEMANAGMDIEVHGREHFELTGRDYDWLIFHLLGPIETIEANLGYRPRFLSYPAGLYDDDVIAVAQEVGYWGAVTTLNGFEQNSALPFKMRRLRIRGEWPLSAFASIMQEVTIRQSN